MEETAQVLAVLVAWEGQHQHMKEAGKLGNLFRC